MPIPDDCLRKITDVLQGRAADKANPGPKILYCLNLVTEEVATVEVNYKKQTFTPDRDISEWKQFSIFERDFVRVQHAS